MAREISGVRDFLVILNDAFPEKELLTKKEVYTFLGIHRDTCKKYYPELWKLPFITKTDFAKILAKKSVA